MLEPIDEHRRTLRAGPDSLDELLVYVAGKGFDFAVHEPLELVERIRTLVIRLARLPARTIRRGFAYLVLVITATTATAGPVPATLLTR